jgi:hypothetical protein
MKKVIYIYSDEVRNQYKIGKADQRQDQTEDATALEIAKVRNLIEKEEMAKVQELVERAKLSLERGAWRRAVHHLKRAEKIAMVYDPI